MKPRLEKEKERELAAVPASGTVSPQTHPLARLGWMQKTPAHWRRKKGKESWREGTVGPGPQPRSQGVWHHLQESWGKAATPRPCPYTMTVTMTLDCACGEHPVAPALPSPEMRRSGDVPTLNCKLDFPSERGICRSKDNVHQLFLTA